MFLSKDLEIIDKLSLWNENSELFFYDQIPTLLKECVILNVMLRIFQNYDFLEKVKYF